MIKVVVSVVFHPQVLHVVSEAQQAKTCQGKDRLIVTRPPAASGPFCVPQTPPPGSSLRLSLLIYSPKQRHDGLSASVQAAGGHRMLLCMSRILTRQKNNSALLYN